MRIMLECTDTYHEQLFIKLYDYDMGIYVAIVSHYRIKEFAKGMGILTKTNK